MRKRLISIMLAGCAICSVPAAVGATGSDKITIEQLQKMFDNIRAKTTWDLDGPLLWGYYFSALDPKKLQRVAEELARSGYRVVDTHPANGKPWYLLHVEKVEHHTPQSLDQRNREFYRFAEQHQLRSYDGMDVGPVQ